MRTSKPIIVGLASLFLLIASASESFAGVKLYNGAWIAESFGNDKVGIGTEASAFFEALGIPQGTLCHPAAPLCSFSSTPETTANTPALRVWHPLGPGCRPLTAGEKPRPAKGGTNKPGGASCPGAPPTAPPCSKEPPLYRNKAFFTAGSLPDPQSCIAESTVGATKQPVETASKATKYLGYGDPLRGIAMKGSPVTGSGLITTSGAAPKRDFKFPSADAPPLGSIIGMRRSTTGSFVGEGPYLYSYTYADLRNDAGEFGAGKGFFSTAAGPTVAEFKNKAGGSTVATITVKDGTNRFGGVMKLLGSYTTKVCYLYGGGCGLGYGTWAYEDIGAAGAKLGGVVTAPAVDSLTFTYFNTAAMTIAKYDQVASRWPWTTGTVTVNATARGAHKTWEQRKGFDNRTGSGVGTVQLVSPVLTQWLAQTANGPKLETGGIAILQIKFVPEPGVLTGLVAGLSLLAVLSRFRRS